MTKKQRVLVITFACMMGLAGVGMFCYIIYVSVQGVINPGSSPVEDRKLIVTAEEMRIFEGPEVVPENEKFHSQKAFDGSRTVEYSYSHHADSGGRFYLSSTAQIFPQSLTTMQMFRMQQFAIKGGLSMAGETTTEPAQSLLTLGDDHYAAVLKTKATGVPVGNLFIVRKGRAMLTVIVIGIQLTERTEVETLLGPAVEEMSRRFGKR
jgi:hypothetical protein